MGCYVGGTSGQLLSFLRNDFLVLLLLCDAREIAITVSQAFYLIKDF